MDTFLQDIRYALRQLVRSPGFTLVAVATLALGIGANTALFTMSEAVLARPLPGVRAAERLFWLAPVSGRSGRALMMSYPDYVDYRDRSGVFAELAAFDGAQFSLSGNGEPERVRGQLVSGNFFSVLGTPMHLGRGLTADDDRTPGAHPVVAISYDLWQRRFEADPAVVGRRLMVNGASFTVVGVTPARFNGPAHAERNHLWMPMMMQARAYPQWPDMLTRRGAWWLQAFGRLKPGVPPHQANAAVATVAAQIAREDSAGHGELTARLFELRSGMEPGDGADVVPVAALAAVVTGLILLIACANVSNLLLGRAVARRREIGVRLSLGAGRWRVVRQLLTESILLSAAAGALGLLVAAWATDLLASQIPSPLDVSIDRRVLGFAAAAALATGVLFGLVPALHGTRSDLAGAIKDSTTGYGTRRSRLQGGFVVAQISLSLVLLATAGLFLHSLYKAARIRVGFDATTQVLAASFDLGLQGYTPERAETFLREVAARAAALPGVEAVSFTNQVPMSDRIIGTDILLEGEEGRARRFGEGAGMEVYQSTVRPNFFRTIGIPLLRGRDFTFTDHGGAEQVIIVSENFARRAWPNADPLGKRLSVTGTGGRFLTVVGVVREAMVGGVHEQLRPVVYLAQLQHPRTLDLTLLVRSASDARALAGPIRRAIKTLDPHLPVYAVQSLAQYRSDRMAETRLGSGLLGIFGVLALLLATVGVYGVMAFSVSQRTREVGVRVALGALQQQVVRLFVSEGMRLTAVGIAIGLALSIVVAKVLSSVFFGITPADALTFGAVATLLALVALVACWVPARRAAKVDPMRALRYG
ncbi:MAG: ABC transporter permease [Gemmatimonadota bacterium]|nr:ABC transporter permease [Gemmatimonadota bacterium]